MKRVLFAALLLVLFSFTAKAQKVAVQTNALDWIALGTVNAEAQLSFSQHYSLIAGGRINPWSFGGNRCLQSKKAYVGVKYWPWYVYSGWWLGASYQWSEFTRDRILTNKKIAARGGRGAGISIGYSYMLSKSFNLDLGAGICFARYRSYSETVGGVPVNPGKEEKSQSFIQPDFLAISLTYVF